MMFGKPNSKPKKSGRNNVVIQTVVPKEVYEQLQKVVKENGLHISSLIRLIIMQHLNPQVPDNKVDNVQTS